MSKETSRRPGERLEGWLAGQDWPPPVAAAAEAAGARVHLVGGAVRDALLGIEVTDVDLAVEGDAVALALALDPRASVHERFMTARIEIGGRRLDLARTRSEAYAHPGTLPEVAPAAITADLDRRDFTINAIATPLDDPRQPIDPHGGIADLAAGRLEILHEASFRDDPTRALRGARYSARLGFALGALTADRIARADLTTVSADRTEAELHAILTEPVAVAVAALRLGAEWGLLSADSEAACRVLERAALAPWRGATDPPEVALEAAGVSCGGFEAGVPARAERIAAAGEDGKRPSELARLARGASASELLIARTLGAEWVERYFESWRHVRPRIDGRALLDAGVPRGPRIGAGLDAALAARLDGEAPSAAAELEIALRAADAA